ncbi:MAG TPA: FtsX-like permease family protein, partial [Vicinamibacterales bacterium]|nr:FtsX-like permease family protein [Vicinamibacterales bacterium]
PPESLERSVRSAVHDVDRDQALSDVRSLEQIVNESMLGNRVVSMILAIFSAMALSLAVAGIYGVISYTGLQRTHEMGLRAALGATAGDLCRLIMRRGMLLTVGGLAIGLAGMIPSTDVLSSMLYGVGTYDPLTIAIVSVVLSAVAGLACFLPAWRVAHADPMEALRYP